jgi:hypothetical protein
MCEVVTPPRFTFFFFVIGVANMPSKSKAQYKLFEIASYNKDFAEARHINQEQAREWHAEDKKKRKEDPKWYDNLPEKAEDDDKKKDHDKKDGKKKDDKAKKGDESMEGQGLLLDFIDGLFDFFSSKKKKDVDSNELYESKWTFIDKAEKTVQGTYTNKEWLAQIEVKDGMIPFSDIGPLLRLKPWPQNLLDGIEKGVNEIEKFLIAYSSAFTTYQGKMEKLWDEFLKSDDYVEAAEKFKAEQKKIAGPMNALKVPHGTLGNFKTEIKRDIYHSIVSEGQSCPTYWPALSANGVEKAGKLMFRILGILDDQHDRHDWWYTDVKEDWKYAARNGKFEENEKNENAFYSVTELVDNSYDPVNYYYDQPMLDQLTKTIKALDKLITRSVK